MPDSQTPIETPDDTVAVTLKLDAQVYRFFLDKANRAGMAIEPYLGSTLSIVLGCRAFSEKTVGAPQVPVLTRSPCDEKNAP